MTLALFTLIAIVRLCRLLNLLSRGTFLLANGLLFLTLTSRGVYLMVYCHSSTSYSTPPVFSHIIYNIVLPGISAVYGVVVVALVKYSEANINVSVYY